jgi:hypothetical protein
MVTGLYMYSTRETRPIATGLLIFHRAVGFVTPTISIQYILLTNFCSGISGFEVGHQYFGFLYIVEIAIWYEQSGVNINVR